MNDLEKKVIKTKCWSMIPLRETCCYCNKPAVTVLKSWYGLHFSRALCKDHELEFFKRRKEF